MRGSVVRSLGGVVCLLFSGSLAAFAQQELLQASQDGRTMLLVPAGEAALLELPGGRSLRLTLPEWGEVSSLAALDGGWIAAGSYPAPAGGRRLFLLRGNDTAARGLAEPPAQEGAERREPVLLVDRGRLAGLAWLEGDGPRTLAVQAAVFKDGRWLAPQRVSWPGPGSQLALAGAVLDDGSWLLAWSAFDGEDDEIVWSQRVGEAWLPVRRLSPGNGVPDITPAVTALRGGGALLAWSRYDGRGYRLRLSRFERGEWRGEQAAGPSGSLYPSFVDAATGVGLLYMDAWPRAWTILALDGAGRIAARATAPSASARPAVAFEGGKVRMRWPNEKRETAVRLEKSP